MRIPKSLIFEFLRYAVVGGISFVADAGTLALTKEILFSHSTTKGQIALCTALGFAVGLAVNWLLSNLFVFRSASQRAQGKTAKSFLIYTVVGLIGLGLTELGMLAGVSIFGTDGLWYLLTKCVVAGIVMVWNYVGRKIFVYHGE